MRVAMAGNVLAPASAAIQQLGYALERHPDWPGWLVARKGEDAFQAENPVELLGLIAMVQLRGDRWEANDRELADYLQRLD
ncbi:hypothetical protein SAMN04487939_101614 [Lysobacter sp. yr284]|uniref:hypothetical protein n=1 Tax=Lysobacter TaxID=68 RepID=UPI0008952B48|nr:hypothetical protein [Lysobacter sp. yr284]SDY28062.1 hypothetical protein SAMN04487939_101614 [Lysobacter sp. yr284]